MRQGARGGPVEDDVPILGVHERQVEQELMDVGAHACAAVIAAVMQEVGADPYAHAGARPPSTRASPIRRVMRSASRCSRKASAYFREVPAASRSPATVICPS